MITFTIFWWPSSNGIRHKANIWHDTTRVIVLRQRIISSHCAMGGRWWLRSNPGEYRANTGGESHHSASLTRQPTDREYVVYSELQRSFVCSSHIEADIKWPPFYRRHSHMYLLNENWRILIQTSLMFVPKGPLHKKSAFVQLMA